MHITVSILSMDEFRYKAALCTRLCMKLTLVFLPILSVDEVKFIASASHSLLINDNLPDNHELLKTEFTSFILFLLEFVACTMKM